MIYRVWNAGLLAQVHMHLGLSEWGADRLVSEPSLTIGWSPRIGMHIITVVIIEVITPHLVIIYWTKFSYCHFSVALQNVSNPCGEIFAAMDDEWERSDYLIVGGFPPLLWETLQRLGYTKPPMYNCSEYDEEGVVKCEVHLHIRKHPSWNAFQTRYITVFAKEYYDTAQKATRQALAEFC